MSMLLRCELRKTLLTPVHIGFIILCCVLNIAIAVSYSKMYYGETNSEPYNIFEGYSTCFTAEHYIVKYEMTGEAAENMIKKYDKLQYVVDAKAINGDAFSIYFGSNTRRMHRLLFGTLLYAITAEGVLFALFAALMSTGYENICNTEQIICASKIGRHIMKTKFAISLIAGIVSFAVILAVSLTVFFILFDYSAVWNDNVSSSFNNGLTTWHSFTVAGLLLAVIGAAAGLTVIFTLLGFAIGVFFRNSYFSCGVAVALCILQYITPLLFQIGGTLRGILNLTPIMLSINSGKWFTDGGAGIVWANFESVGLISSFLILAAVSFIAISLYKRRNLL